MVPQIHYDGYYEKQANKQKPQKITSDDENVEKLELLDTSDENRKWCSHCGKHCGSS